MMLRAYGPLPLLKGELAGLAGVDEVRIFGSWARRFNGEVGHAPQDVDVLVLGDREAMDELEVRARCATVSDLAGVTVNATVVDGEDWTEDRSAFAEEVKSGPTVLVWSADDEPSEVAARASTGDLGPGSD